MPNLSATFDTSQFYDPDITRYYNFKPVKIKDLTDYKLLLANFTENKNEYFLYLLTDLEDNNLSIIRLKKVVLFNNIYYQINKSYSIIRYEGFGEILYDLCFNYHQGKILSDSINTLPGSFNLWLKIVKRKKNYSVSIFNKKTGLISDIKKPINEFEIWGVPIEFLEAIEATPWETTIFEDEYDFIDDDYDESYFVNYLTEHEKYERTYLSDYIVKALKSKSKIKDRGHILLLVSK